MSILGSVSGVLGNVKEGLGNAYAKTKKHINDNGRYYLIGAGIVGLCIAAYFTDYIIDNLKPIETVRVGGGRTIAFVGAESSFVERDPTPVLRRLAGYIAASAER